MDDVEDEPELPVPPGMMAKGFDDWVDMDKDSAVTLEATEEDEEEPVMQKIVQGQVFEDLANEEPEEKDDEIKEPTPSNADMWNLLHHLWLGLERRAFPEMEDFQMLDRQVQEHL